MTEANSHVLAPTPRAARQSIMSTVLHNPVGLGALIVLACVVLLSIFAPLFAPFSPTEVRIESINAPMGGEFLLGGDGVGRDILSRLVFAGRNTLIGALIAVGVAMTGGVISGLLAGYFGKFFDSLASWMANVLMAMPSMILLLALFKALGSSMFMAMVVFGVLITPGFFRLVRGLVINVKNELYVDAARVSGLSNSRIIGRHILLVVRAPVVIQTAVVAGVAIVLQSGLEFLGLGDPSLPTWGGMLQDAFANIYVSPTAIIWPGSAIAITVASLVLLGNAIRDGFQRVDTGPAKRRQKRGAPSSPTEPASSAEVVEDDPNVLLSLRNVGVGYSAGETTKEVVRGINLQVHRGEVLGLVGESGSGKTQTAFSILGLLAPGGHVTRGSIIFDGKEISNLPAPAMRALRGKRIAYVPQEPMSNLDPSFRIGDQLTEPLRAVLGLSKKQATEKALALLARVGIPNPQRTFDAYPHEISGGMAQRVLIAGAISCEPDLLIADEVTTALDVTIQAEVLDLLRELQRELSMAVILVTHNFGVVADLCDRVAVMQNGQIIETNTALELFANPTHPYTQMLLSSTLEDSVPRDLVVANQGAR
ncbi:dipeptide/oligopeptide/nickel ABC transporter permease/ATP-binding protein [Arthrobacter sp. GMC3]|uniref:dipeptide/oligopeptide/nickel ABC transporter permease/ATP-binding protein n=1 Tax=Arthrobacter sp. GMC3 TaxID=2058894 RepID=UPI000CE390D0|nr:dipeptide/oligopeptide/nickel ABC transporter permease/ATP-binding protein [Arthrobacter sp. GMC3]